VKVEEAPAGGSGKLENNSENQEKSKKWNNDLIFK
jgi:hypothetical protein